MFKSICYVFLLLIITNQAFAQEYKFDDLKLTIMGSSRTRYEFENWYGTQQQKTSYSFPSEKIKLGFDISKNNFKFSLAGQYYGIYNLDYGASGPASSFINTNSNSASPSAFSLRTASIQYENENDKIILGRQNYFNGQGGKLDQDNNDLTYLMKWRVAQRIIGPSEFTAGRSFDGIYSEKNGLFDNQSSIQVGYFKPTQGSGFVNPSRQITDINIGILSFTKEFQHNHKQIGQAQLFYYYFGDSRNVVKTDNRSLDIRQLDFSDIKIHNFGGHWIGSIPVGKDSIDSTIWGVAQTGDWGDLKQRAWAGVFELGYHFQDILWKPWIRTGINITSGDGSSSNSTHSTFSQLINTPRNFALTPFFNMQNTNDQFVQTLLYPNEKLTIRSDLHNLRLTNSSDLLYSGAGASKVSSFGYGGLSSNGSSNIGTLIDFGANYKFCKNMSMDFYVGHLWGGAVIASNFPGGKKDINYGLIDLNLAF